MKLRLDRDIKTPQFTLGRFYVDGHLSYWTVEDCVRDHKIPGQTAIPAGDYKVIVNHSLHFDKDLPLLLNVPNYEGVRIHSGNTAADTEGCILIGITRTKDGVAGSRMAMEAFMPQLNYGLLRGDVWLSVS